MRNVVCALLAVAAGCGIQNKVAPDGGLVDGVVTGDGSDGSGSSTELTITVTDKPPTLGNSANVSFTFETSLPATTQCKADNEAFHDCASPLALASLADGIHTFDINATAGEQHAAIPTYSFAVDTIAPAMMITGQPPASSPVATAQFYFQKDDSTTVSCQLDSQQAMTPCASPVSYSALADGSHTFTVTGTDGAGNTANAMYTWTIDTTTPAVQITNQPPNPSTSSTATFQFTTGNSVSVTCQLDTATAAACTGTSKTYTGLADGSHTFILRGTNSAGTTTTRMYTWTVDATPPSVTIDSAPPAMTSSTTAQFGFTVTGATTVTCQLDSGTPAACTDPWSYTGLADGAHTFTLTAVDGAGNTTTKTKNWTVDTIPPSVTINSTPPNPSTSASAQFGFTVTGATATTCQLDSAVATSCTNTASYSSLSEGMHTFTVRATDAAANATTRSYSWTVDTVAPTLVLTSTPPSSTNMTSAQFTFTTGDAVTVTCQLDSATPATCSGSVSYSGLTDGSHTFTLKGTDSAGNIAIKTYPWTVDSSPPTLTLNTYPTNPSTSASATFTFTITGASSGTCQLDSQTATSCTTTVSYTSLTEGMHTFTLAATDGAGNSASKTYSWSVDTTPPALTVSQPPSPTNQTSVSIAFTVGDSVSYTCQLDGGNQQSCSTPFTASGLAAQAQHSFTLRGTDGAGNTATKSVVWTIDTIPPSVSITGHPSANSTSRSATFNFSVSEGQPMCSLDLAPSVACSSGITYSSLADGGHTFVVSTTDAAGNYNSDVYSWTVDATGPSITGLGYSCDINGFISVTWSISDANGVASQTCSYPNGQNSGPCVSPWTGYLSGTQSTWNITATDGFGNTTSKNLTIKSLVCQ